MKFRLLIVIILSGFSTVLNGGIYKTITALQADTLIKNHKVGTDLIILDVRTAAEFTAERIDKAINLDYYAAYFNDSLSKLDKTKIYLVYCASGSRSNSAMNKMKALNFDLVYNLSGGLPAWKAAGLPTIKGSGSGLDYFVVYNVNVRFYPNPVSDYSMLEVDGYYQGDMEIEIINALGGIVQKEKLSYKKSLIINGYLMSPGLYFYRAILPGKFVRTGKFQVVR